MFVAGRIVEFSNVAVTAPYMHDGSIRDLDGVIDHYAAGGRTTATGPRAAVGADGPNKNATRHRLLDHVRRRPDL